MLFTPVVEYILVHLHYTKIGYPQTFVSANKACHVSSSNSLMQLQLQTPKTETTATASNAKVNVTLTWQLCTPVSRTWTNFHFTAKTKYGIANAPDHTDYSSL